MIASICVENFKCFRKASIDIGKLTVLAGLNGMGKSSVIQALLILRQSYLSGDLTAGGLLIAGDLIDLGTGSDILFEDAAEEVIRLGFAIRDARGETTLYKFAYRYDRDSERLSRGEEEASEALRVPLVALADAAPFGPGFWYVQAERFGPRKSLPMSSAHVQRRDLGARGEFVLHHLLASTDSVISEGDPRLKALGSSRRLVDQVDCWLQEISPGSHLDIEPIRSADLMIGGYRFNRSGDISSRRFRATNVGFGLSYSLPIIVALLSAKPGDLVVVENPEAHVHPRGQTQLGRLCALAAAAGVQVLVETHSDHFVDGVRLAVRFSEIKPEECRFHYFERREGEVTIESPILDTEGRLSFWPQGFFDQHEENLAALLAPRPSA